MRRQVCLINPPQTDLWNPLSYPPLGLLYIAAMLEAEDFPVKIHNQPHKTLEEQKNDIPWAAIYGITATTAMMPVVKELVKVLREINPCARVVVGGIHATVNPHETLAITDADHVIDGEGEFVFVEFCKKPRDFGKVIKGPRIYDLDSLPFPARHLLPREIIQDKSGIHLEGCYEGNDYATTVITSRGCPYRCAFCSKTRVTEGVRYRSPENIFKELVHLRDEYDIHQFRIVDDTLTFDRYRLEELMDLTAGEEMYFTTILRADSIKDKAMLELMHRGGVRIVSIGMESANQGILDTINKREKIGEIKQVIQWCREVGIKSKVFCIFGLPGETLETVEETKQFFRDVKPDFYTLSSLQPLPGSDIYEHPDKYGLKPLHHKGDYNNFWFYYEPEDVDKGFHFEMPLEVRKARGDLIKYLRSGEWRRS